MSPWSPHFSIRPITLKVEYHVCDRYQYPITFTKCYCTSEWSYMAGRPAYLSVSVRSIVPTEADVAALPHFGRQRLQLTKFLGSGAFGEVFEGVARDIHREDSGNTRVAVKVSSMPEACIIKFPIVLSPPEVVCHPKPTPRYVHTWRTHVHVCGQIQHRPSSIAIITSTFFFFQIYLFLTVRIRSNLL